MLDRSPHLVLDRSVRCVCLSLRTPPERSCGGGLLCLYVLQPAGRAPLGGAVAVAELARAALQSNRGRLTAGSWSPTLSGHTATGVRTDQHRHLHCFTLPQPKEGVPALLGFWAPEGFDRLDLAAALSLRELRGGPAGPIQLGRPAPPLVRSALRSLVGPAQLWESVTPFAPPRYPKRRGDVTREAVADQVRRELAHRNGRLADLLFSVSELPLAGFRSFPIHRKSQLDQGGPPRPRARLQLRFTEPVYGPLALGFNCHFGVGLFRSGPT